mmetsp:Transcript_33935/g.58289  ORF Transcript_33935/g.58289 Transcript_33935/m.58289 type:complete len:81 (-) Transcript_33935:35-277(-)|eukprot:CAMPEP_0184972558 /NCGR_PEP_ID=MMETSP1098-20130426/4529_1 /TAXON_ID=89044 /ORGANISM="Spumella elongata, Strain CCAP 955/1" /LENGTH=80 /DNA_ID=CAMNT_0027494869 /DNA_START=45 /DNA_END=287 /DNA_ORIENTATION=-
MADSELSASELRKRYLRGGTLNDDELTSAQLRARHAIPSNSKDFGSSASGKSGSAGPIVVIAALVLVAVVVGYLFLQNQS